MTNKTDIRAQINGMLKEMDTFDCETCRHTFREALYLFSTGNKIELGLDGKHITLKINGL
jgi:hypothetical protein